MMPENLPLTLVIVGAILLLIGLLGGQFKIFGAEVPGKVGRASRWISGFTGVVLIVVGIHLGSGGTNLFSPTPSTQQSAEQPGPEQPARPHTLPETPKTPPPARAADPDRLFIETAQLPHTDNGRIRDPRLREAVLLALQGEDIPRARRLMAEAGWPDGLTVALPMHSFIAAGGTQEDVQRIERRLATIGMRLEIRD